MSWKMAVTAAIIVLVIATLLHTAWEHRRGPALNNYLRVLRAMRWTMIPVALGTLVLVVVTSTLLYQIPILQWGWWRLLGGNGNAVLGQTTFDGIGWRLTAIAVPVLVLVLLPALAYLEENGYRRGSETESWPRRIRRQLWFGLAHSLSAGVPLAVGLALTIWGLIFTGAYLRSYRRSLALTPEPGPALVTVPRTVHEEFDLMREELETARTRRREAQDIAVAHAAALHTVSNMIVVLVTIFVVITLMAL